MLHNLSQKLSRVVITTFYSIAISLRIKWLQIVAPILENVGNFNMIMQSHEYFSLGHGKMENLPWFWNTINYLVVMVVSILGIKALGILGHWVF